MITKSDLLRLKQMVENPNTGLKAVNSQLVTARKKINDLTTEPIVSALPIGSVIQSFLTIDNFQSLYGFGWVLCDGSSCEGTAFSKLSRRQFLPDLKGKFLRTGGGNAAEIGLSQDQMTAVNGLTNSNSEVSGGTVIGTVTATKHLRTDSSKHSHELDYYHYSWGDNRGVYDERYGSSQNSSVVGDKSKSKWIGSIKDSGDHTHSIPPHSHEFRGSILGKREAAAQTISGDLETRPEKVSVNTFIRVN